MKIMFIKPPNHGFYHEIERFYPVGIAYLASACRNAGHEVIIFDSLVYVEDNCCLEDSQLSEGQKDKKVHHPSWRNIFRWGASYERIEQKIRDENPDVVSITAMHTPMYDTAYKVAEIARMVNPAIYIIMGGSHPSILPEHVMKFSVVDYVLMGEGEQSIVKLLECIQKDLDIMDIGGIVFRKYYEKTNCHRYRADDDYYTIYINEEKDWIYDLDQLSFPAADLLEMDKYNHVTIITSRGCPNRCSFCTVHPTVGKIHRVRTVENVIEEVKYYINNFGIRVFHFEDDNFSLDFKRANEILNQLIELDADITLNLPNGITAINIDEPMIEKYGKLKMNESFIGLETTSTKQLEKINKRFTSLNKVEGLVKLFQKYGMNIGVSLVVGFPEQTVDEMISDIVQLISHDIEFGTANPCYPIPQSELYDECLQKGFIKKEKDFTWYDEFNFPLETNFYSRGEIYQIWCCSLVYAKYPVMLQIMKQGFASVKKLIDVFQQQNFGELYEFLGGYYCVPRKEDTFSYDMKLSNRNKHNNIFVDTLTADIIACLFTMFTGDSFHCYQTESMLGPNGRTAFYVKKTNQPMENIRMKLITEIHKCNQL